MSSIRSASSRTRISTWLEVGHLLADEVEQAAGRRDEDLDAAAQGLDLRVHRDAAVDHGRAQRDGPAVGPDALVDLHRQLARGHEDQGAHRVAGRRERGVGVRPQPVEDGQGEGRRLAGAGLGGGEDVAALEDERDGRGLDRGGGGVALLGDGLQQIGRQAERVKGQAWCSCVGPAIAAGGRPGARRRRSDAVPQGGDAGRGPRRSIAENRVPPERRRQGSALRFHARDVGRQGRSRLAYSGPAPRPAPDRQAQQKNAAPTAGTCRSRRVPRTRRPRIRLTRIAGSAPRSPPSGGRRRARPRLSHPPAAGGHHAPSPRAHRRGVLAERRQESCRSTKTAPSGRPSTGHVA